MKLRIAIIAACAGTLALADVARAESAMVHIRAVPEGGGAGMTKSSKTIQKQTPNAGSNTSSRMGAGGGTKGGAPSGGNAIGVINGGDLLLSKGSQRR